MELFLKKLRRVNGMTYFLLYFKKWYKVEVVYNWKEENLHQFD